MNRIRFVSVMALVASIAVSCAQLAARDSSLQTEEPNKHPEAASPAQEPEASRPSKQEEEKPPKSEKKQETKQEKTEKQEVPGVHPKSETRS
jgi:Ni/Co efflux regulator RcnB